MATSAKPSPDRSTADLRTYEITSTSDGDTEVSFPNDLKIDPSRVQVQIEPPEVTPGKPLPAAYLASDWRISDQTTRDTVVLIKTPAPGSGSEGVQAIAAISVAPSSAQPSAAQPPAARRSQRQRR